MNIAYLVCLNFTTDIDMIMMIEAWYMMIPSSGQVMSMPQGHTVVPLEILRFVVSLTS